MGQGNFGGDGSVRWDVSTRRDRNFDPGNAQPGNPRRCGGVDEQHGGSFIVRVKPPRGMAPAAYLEQLRRELIVTGGRIELRIAVEDMPPGQGTPQQIQVEW